MRRMHVVAGSIMAVSLGSAGCGDSGKASGAPGPSVTYYADVKPILDAKCKSCHFDGGIAPFSVESYATLAPYAGLIEQQVSTGEMPPWPPDPACNDYLGDRSLTPAQIATIAAWADGGALEGDPAKEGAPLDASSLALSRTDLTLTIPEYTPVEEPDEYRCVVLDWPETATTYVSGFAGRPGEPRVVHHLIAYLAPPDKVADVEALDAAAPGLGYPCFGGPGFERPTWLGGWVPGTAGYDYAEGTGIRVDPGSKVILQIHYNTLHAGKLPDATSIEMKLDAAVTKEGRMQPWANPQWIGTELMAIPALAEDVTHSFAADPTQLTGGQPILVHTAGLHMHTLGTHARLSVARADGSSTCVLDIPSWDFHWQGAYPLAQPVELHPGDKLGIECHWDNTPEKQPVIDGVPQVPKDVYWGESTTDEMCLANIYMTPL